MAEPPDHQVGDLPDDELGDALRAAIAAPVPPVDDERLDQLRRAVEARRASGSSGASASAAPLAPRRRTRWPAVAAVAAAVVAAVAVATFAVVGDDDPPGSLEFAGQLEAPEGAAQAEVSVRRTGIGRVVRLRTDELPILATGELYEVWFVAPGDGPDDPRRISAGTFHPDQDGRTEVQLAAAVDPALYPVLEVTAEPGDGDPAVSGAGRAAGHDPAAGVMPAGARAPCRPPVRVQRSGRTRTPRKATRDASSWFCSPMWPPTPRFPQKVVTLTPFTATA